MKAKTTEPKKHSGNHSDVLSFCVKCIELYGDDSPGRAALRIWDGEWMSPDSKTGSDFKTLETDCIRTWDKATEQIESGATKQKRLREAEKLRLARNWVDTHVRFDTFLGQYLNGDTPTGPAAEYDSYNAQANDLTFIEKHYFQNAFEVDRMERTSVVKAWGESLPKWDNKDWIKELCKYIPAKDQRQAELFLKGWLIRCYIQAVNPEELDYNSIVNRWFLILYQHRQESGKSGFFRWLAPQAEWVKENGLEDDKDGYIALARYLFILDDELGVLSRISQLERLKSMISISKIDVRLPYGKADTRAIRVASFCGSTNNEDIFPPSEGTTRFLILPLTEDAFKWEVYIKKIDRTKLWSQVKHLAGTAWLKDNNAEIIKYRSETNVGFIKEDIESFVVTRYLTEDSNATVVLRAGDIMNILCGSEYGYNNLNMVRLGQALKKEFGDRVFGKSLEGGKCRGYKIQILPPNPVPEVSEGARGKGGVRPSPFKAKQRRRPQR
jgi:hypothetical protein